MAALAECTNGNVYYYLRVVHLECGFNQSHSIVLLYMEWLLWQTAQMEMCIITCVWCILSVVLINHTLSHYFTWDGSGKTVQMEMCIITCVWCILYVVLTKHTLSYCFTFMLVGIALTRLHICKYILLRFNYACDA